LSGPAGDGARGKGSYDDDTAPITQQRQQFLDQEKKGSDIGGEQVIVVVLFPPPQAMGHLLQGMRWPFRLRAETPDFRDLL
jgi:hypothetical protein